MRHLSRTVFSSGRLYAGPPRSGPPRALAAAVGPPQQQGLAGRGFSAAGAPDVSASAADTTSNFTLPRLLVFGGNGFVGSRVCEEALRTGLNVVSVNRSGRPQGSQAWADQVEWVQADVFDTASWRAQLDGAIGVVSCLGAFGSNEFMQRICGDSNSSVFREAASAGVPRAVFVSVHDYGFPDAVLRGYFQGKKFAEASLRSLFPDSGVALRPGFIHGTRKVGSVGIPLGLVGAPLDRLLGLLPAKSLADYPLVGAAFVPPVSVEAVAKAAVAAATDPSVPGGPMSVWDIKANYEL